MACLEHHCTSQTTAFSCGCHTCSRNIDNNRAPTSLSLMTSSVHISIPLAYTGVRWKFFTKVLSMYCKSTSSVVTHDQNDGSRCVNMTAFSHGIVTKRMALSCLETTRVVHIAINSSNTWTAVPSSASMVSAIACRTTTTSRSGRLSSKQ